MILKQYCAQDFNERNNVSVVKQQHKYSCKEKKKKGTFPPPEWIFLP